MKIPSSAVVLLCIAAVAGCASQPTVTVPFAEAGVTCAKVKTFPLCVTDMRAGFPQIKPGDEALGVLDFDTNDNDNDSELVITFSPDVTGPHTVLSKEFSCIENYRHRQYWCHLDQIPAYFDTVPEYYLKIEGDISSDDAEAIVHLLATGKVVANKADWSDVLPHGASLGDIRYYHLMKQHGGYTLVLSTDGCWGPVQVTLEGAGDSRVLRITDVNEMCI